ncbi:MAG: Asp-tRNA(Asn)/Glu-tRNA(Gln) amidotransferase subunit GatB [Chitinophagaceae bacterium]|nr:Asp-tRNA(Asn)/Glu-tRNA(Gln) amidotransferase subunit GatB [Chitinophagaceae bacterium]MCA6451975.1 Asp-tRNA(Asn)/Glu-tRNA(Gln) amidotransferase subunit GatB [Chitinophagaceae bacterium]MCA6458669.1 Asp-tRNA(Asn)/Glu-tRNA(Gln) amidotransferase subunit GatB [Chitinophagaceae bacterium]MCA6466088.1 Asp-tRNA(Asn)/Glu-tRNA(Gln) amidotransferase subunit GatB [Chitinophagaceae bacterium]
MSWNDKYEAVIGLEVHAQLATNSKLFCGDSTAFGAAPNTHISPITMGHPGTLPKTNKKAVEYAIKLGLACGCEIEKDNYFARKNYFYPDLPKGYQISQHTTPICKGGHVTIQTPEGERQVQLNRIHMEEDAGKSIHDLDEHFTCIDLNRAGTPLVEIVTEPDIFSAEEAWSYVTEIRRLVRWIGICDGNMEEGSLRCDANVSIRLKGETKLGTKVEVKNLNSIRNVKKAIEYEISRMVELVENGGKVQQQTRSFDASTDTTFAIRDKEEANDYRYFPDPDLAPFHLTDTFIQSIASTLPALPADLKKKYQLDFGLSAYDAGQLCDEKETTDFFASVIEHTRQYKAVANWVLGPIRQYQNEHGIGFAELQLAPALLAELIQLVDDGKVSFSVASSKLLPAVISGEGSPLAIAEKMNLLQVSDTNELETWITEALESMPDKVTEYRKGKKGLIGLFVGDVKKRSKGKADPKLVTQLLEQKLNQ